MLFQPIVVLGSSGALGSEICHQARESGRRVIAFDRSNFNPQEDLAKLAMVFDKQGAKAIINCMAMTGLDLCHKENKMAYEINGLFPIKLAILSKILNLPTVNFSTELVFPCNVTGRIYSETDIPQPTTDYGLTKFAGEATDLRHNTPYFVIRLPLLYGPTNNKQIVGRLIKRLTSGDEITVSSDVYSTPVYTPDIAAFAINLVEGRKDIPSVTHLTSERRVSLYEFMITLAKNFALEAKVMPILSKEFQSLVPKPLHCGLASIINTPLPFEASIDRFCSWIRSNVGAS